jgi:hypothetical protein
MKRFQVEVKLRSIRSTSAGEENSKTHRICWIRSQFLQFEPRSNGQAPLNTTEFTMMKLAAALLMAIVAMVAVDTVLAQGNCFKHWTRAEGGTSGGQQFTGITLINNNATENYNNPLWYALADAQTGLSAPAKGRLSAALPTTTFTGTVTFDFFAAQNFLARIFKKRRKNQLTINFVKGTNSGTITGGNGCYKGLSAGTATRLYINGTLPKVFEWTFCPTTAASCTPK